MLKVLIIGGTREARELAARLSKVAGLEVHVTVATEYGGDCLADYPQLQVHQGRLDQEAMTVMLQRFAVKLVVDASHPFATAVSLHASRAASVNGIPYLRLERPVTPAGGPGIIAVPDFESAARRVAAMSGNILLTIGSNHLEVFTRLVPDFQRRLYVRVLPVSVALQKCEALGLTARNILAMQGPFSEAWNREMLRYCNAAVLVTKDSGAAGGGETKLSAARDLKIPVALVTRPRSGGQPTVASVTEAVEWVNRKILKAGKDNGSFSLVY
jgi:precorrin-6A/cobalt-precorrin-6A reductase